MAQAHFPTALTKIIFGVGVYGTERKKRMGKYRKGERGEESKKKKKRERNKKLHQ